MKWKAGVLCASIALAGCGRVNTSTPLPPPTTTSQSSIPAGWKLTKAGGVSLALPADWIAVDVSRPDVTQAVEHLGLKGQEGEMMKQQIRSFASMGVFKILAFAPLKVGEFQSNVNVNVLPSPSADMKEMLEGNKRELAKAGKILESGIVENPRRAVLVAEMEYPTPSGAPVKYVTQGHLFIRGQEQITITFSSSPENHVALKKIVDQAIKTFAYDPPTAGTPPAP